MVFHYRNYSESVVLKRTITFYVVGTSAMVILPTFIVVLQGHVKQSLKNTAHIERYLSAI